MRHLLLTTRTVTAALARTASPHRTAAARATAKTTIPAAAAATPAAAVSTAAADTVSPVLEVPDVRVEGCVLASQYSWLERTSGGVFSGERMIKRAFSVSKAYGGKACGGGSKAQGDGGGGAGAAGKENSGHKQKVGPLARTGLAVRRAIGVQPQRGVVMMTPPSATCPIFEVHRRCEEIVLRI